MAARPRSSRPGRSTASSQVAERRQLWNRSSQCESLVGACMAPDSTVICCVSGALTCRVRRGRQRPALRQPEPGQGGPWTCQGPEGRVPGFGGRNAWRVRRAAPGSCSRHSSCRDSTRVDGRADQLGRERIEIIGEFARHLAEHRMSEHSTGVLAASASMIGTPKPSAKLGMIRPCASGDQRRLLMFVDIAGEADVRRQVAHPALRAGVADHDEIGLRQSCGRRG